VIIEGNTVEVPLVEYLRETVRRLRTAAEGDSVDEVGVFLPIRQYGRYAPNGEFSSLGEWLSDVAATLEHYLDEDEDEIDTWILTV